MSSQTRHLSPAVYSYFQAHACRETDVLAQLRLKTAHSYADMAEMQISPEQGQFMQFLVKAVAAQKVLEIGTFTGYSALCLAKGLTADGILHTLELRETDAARAKTFFDRSVYTDKIILHTGDAKKIIPALNDEFDLVFIDADKQGYIEYFNLVLPKVRKNGFIFADNIFFQGEAILPQPKGKNAKAIRAFNKFIQERTDIEKVVLTLRDGLYLIRKL